MQRRLEVNGRRSRASHSTPIASLAAVFEPLRFPIPQWHTDKPERALMQMEDLMANMTPISKEKSINTPILHLFGAGMPNRMLPNDRKLGRPRAGTLKTTHTPHTCICTIRRRMTKKLRFEKRKTCGISLLSYPPTLMAGQCGLSLFPHHNVRLGLVGFPNCMVLFCLTVRNVVFIIYSLLL